MAFDISDAEQIQTNVSEFNSARANLISSGIQVTIEYYVKDGVNIATKLTSDGDEKEPYGNQVRIKIKIRGQMMQVYSLFIFSASV